MGELDVYEYWDGKIGIQAKFLIYGRDAHPSSLCLVKDRILRYRLKKGYVVRLRPSAPGQSLLVQLDSLPYEWQQLVKKTFGEPKSRALQGMFARNYMVDVRAEAYYASYTYGEPVTYLPAERQIEYTINASVLNLVGKMKEDRRMARRSIKMSVADVWQSIVADCNLFRKTVPHTLPENADRLGRTLSEYKKEGYGSLIHGMYGKRNAVKVAEKEQEALLDELLAHHNNLDNEQVVRLYNAVCERLNWKPITAVTVDNRRKKTDLVTYAGRRGLKEFGNKKAMIVKRTGPTLPMQYWTLDGWDAELLFQETMIRKSRSGREERITTYHNRLTIVVVLDPCSKYPVGYAIGRHENVALIQAALRNAVKHTRELFGGYYGPMQLQSDNYGRGSLSGVYTSIAKHYTPARVGNAKAKVIEPYFSYLNKTYLQYMENWSGFGIQAKRERQPNRDYLDLSKRNLPSENVAIQQLEKVMYLERQAKLSQYQQAWLDVPDDRKYAISNELFLTQFGQTTGFTNRLEAMGLCPTLLGNKMMYDCFDASFRKLAHVDWIVRYDESDLSTVLAESKDGRHHFLLTQKYEQPMALTDRKEGDEVELQKVRVFNKQLEQQVTSQRMENRRVVEAVMDEHPSIQKTLAKLMITDSRGQHKDNKNAARTASCKVVDVRAIEVSVNEDIELIDEDIRDNY